MSNDDSTIVDRIKIIFGFPLRELIQVISVMKKMKALPMRYNVTQKAV